MCAAEIKNKRRFFNRESSWVEFNSRVLFEALRRDVPLLERLRFLCIAENNFDEFFMVRVASVKYQIRRGDHTTCPSGTPPSAQLSAISSRVRELVALTYDCLNGDVLPRLSLEGIRLVRPSGYTSAQAKFVRKFFLDEVSPVLTPVRSTTTGELPYVTNLRLHAAFLLSPTEAPALRVTAHSGDESGVSLAIVQVPPSLDRIVRLPDDESFTFTLLEDVIAEHSATLFPGYKIEEHCLFRVTRDADFGVDEERDEDFVEAMEQILEKRVYSQAVRLSVTRGAGDLRQMLKNGIGVDEDDVYDKAGPLDIGGLIALTALPGYGHLRYDVWQPHDSPMIPKDEPIWDTLKRRDVLLHHPFESFEPITRLLQNAAEDPTVLAIKMTLYRTSGDSPIVAALRQAAQNGKQVTVLVEIKARFDEERNITWAEALERAGAIVIYGIAGLKVHAKALLIVRREPTGVRRYVHLGTGNYNDKTAKHYTDFGLLTTREDIAYETGLFFNAITGYSSIPALAKLSMAPVSLKGRLLQLIEREAAKTSPEMPGLILAKLNSLADPDVIDALYQASQAGVVIRLNVRGICMLVPGEPGLSENITVVSIIDRYLEHGRAFFFRNGGAAEIYASSGDWMPRNLDRRVELLFPVEDEECCAKLLHVLDTTFADDEKAHRLRSDGTTVPLSLEESIDPHKGRLQSQRVFHELARGPVDSTDIADGKVFEVRRKPATS